MIISGWGGQETNDQSLPTNNFLKFSITTIIGIYNFLLFFLYLTISVNNTTEFRAREKKAKGKHTYKQI